VTVVGNLPCALRTVKIHDKLSRSAHIHRMWIVAGILSSTRVDAHNERLTKAALESGVQQIRSRYIPFLIDHDFNRQIGILLEGKVKRLPDGEFALFGAVGLFESEEERDRYSNGAPNVVWEDFTDYLERAWREIRPRHSAQKRKTQGIVHKKNSDNLADLLESHLDSTSIWVDGSVYKVKHLIACTGDLSIHLYPKDHAPPHFHVISKQRGIDARFDLYTLEPLNQDSLTSRDVKKIKDFFDRHPHQLKKLKSEYARMR
jgi:hypothetical protein